MFIFLYLDSTVLRSVGLPRTIVFVFPVLAQQMYDDTKRVVLFFSLNCVTCYTELQDMI